MASKSKVTDSVASHVRNKLIAMCRNSTQSEVAKKLGMSQQGISSIVRGASRPSPKTAELVLGEKVENHKSNARRPLRSDLSKPRVQHSERLQPDNEPGGRVRDEPVPARDGGLLRVQGQGRVGDLVPVARAEEPGPSPESTEKVTRLSKGQRLEVELQNRAREGAGLNPLKIKTYRCGGCQKLFESVGNRFCSKCKHVSIAVLSGREVYE